MERIIKLGLLIWSLAAMTTPSFAIVVDLTSAGSSGVVNEARFYQVAPGFTSSVIRPFLRMSGTPTEQGYNSDGPFQTGFQNTGRFSNHSIRVNDIPVVELNGVLYREFLLDIKQSPGLLSLDKIEVYLADYGNLSSYPDLGSQIYSLDNGGVDSYIKLDASLNSVYGFGDMIFYLPDSLFGTANQFVYLYSLFGLNYPANAGVEEWALRSDPPPSPNNIIPEPATLILCGLGLGLAGLVRRPRARA